MPEEHHKAIELFIVFSRFEHALKMGGFIKGDAGQSAEADWSSFAKALGHEFFEFHRANPAVAEIFSEAPKRAVVEEVVENGRKRRSLGWKEVKVPESRASLIDAVKRIRNNLFHGDKWNPDHKRNPILIDAALAVLEDARQRAKNVASLAEVSAKLEAPPPQA